MSCGALPLPLSLPSDQLQGMISDESSQDSSTDSSETSCSSSSISKTRGLCSLKMALIAVMVDKNPALRSESALHVYAYMCCGGGGL